MTDLTLLKTRVSAAPIFAYACAAILVSGSFLLTFIGGEGGGENPLPWLATLAGLTLVWLVSLSSKSISPALLLCTAVAIRFEALKQLVFTVPPSRAPRCQIGRHKKAGLSPAFRRA